MTGAEAGGDHVVFVDESGDHGLVKIDQNYPVFVLSACVFRRTEYARLALPAMSELKFRWWGHDHVVMHATDIRKARGAFTAFADLEKRARFLEELNDVMSTVPFTLVAAIIDKKRHVAKYKDPFNPYALALRFCLERVHELIRERGDGSNTHLFVEARGKREDTALRVEFDRICSGTNYKRQPLPFAAHFVDKTALVTGVEIADLVSQPIGANYLRPEQPNRAYSIITRKFREKSGVVDGYGRKVFP